MRGGGGVLKGCCDQETVDLMRDKCRAQRRAGVYQSARDGLRRWVIPWWVRWQEGREHPRRWREVSEHERVYGKTCYRCRFIISWNSKECGKLNKSIPYGLYSHNTCRHFRCVTDEEHHARCNAYLPRRSRRMWVVSGGLPGLGKRR